MGGIKLTLEEILSNFGDQMLADFVRTIWEDKTNKKFNQKHKKDALAAANIMMQYLTDRKLFNPIAPNKQADTAFAACLLHNVLFDRKPEHWKNVFNLREKYMSLGITLAEKYHGSLDGIEYTFQIVEAQLGELMPVYACHPVAGQVTYLVWEVLWMYYNRKLLFKNGKS
jgi:hypothetical protein